MFNDLMDNIEWFFNIHDKNKDGFLSKDEVLTLSETMLVSIFHNLCMSRVGLVVDGESSSLSLGMRLEMRTLARSADSCLTHSSTGMRCYPRPPLGGPLIQMVHQHRSRRTNRT